MARSADPHPTPVDRTDGKPVPHSPEGMPAPLKNPPPEPGVKDDKVPGEDYPPARQPFPDHTPDPGITHQ